MKYLSAILTFLFCSISFAQRSQSGPTAGDSCSTPTVLRITKVSNELYYQVDQSKPHKLYTLGEVSNAVGRCSPDKMLFVVADPAVPIRAMLVPPKEQITRVRYFMLNPGGSVLEISWNRTFPKLPVSPDILPEPDDDGPLHPPSKIPTMKGLQ